MKRRHQIIRVCLVVAVLAGVYAYDLRTGYISYLLKIPATRAASTPAYQNGLDLVEIVRGPRNFASGTVDGQNWSADLGSLSPGDTAVVVYWDGPAPDQDDTGRNPFTVTGVSSTGSRFGLRSSFQNQTLNVRIPGCYPPSYRWIDVTVKYQGGPSATWKIENLPRTHATGVGDMPVRLTASAPNGLVVNGSVSPSALSMTTKNRKPNAPGQEYVVEWNQSFLRNEWETLDLENDTPTNKSEAWTTAASGASFSWGYDLEGGTYYPEQHRVEVSYDAITCATDDETLSFPPLPYLVRRIDGATAYVQDPTRPVSRTSPAGVSVSVQPFPRGDMDWLTGGNLNVCLVETACDPHGTTVTNLTQSGTASLPSFPLCARYGGPDHISVQPTNYMSGRCMFNGHYIIDSLSPTSGGNPKPAGLKFHIHHQVVVTRDPVTLVLPL